MAFGRALGFILAVYALLIVSSAMRSFWAVPMPDIPLLVVLYLGLSGRGALSSHIGIALAIGYLADLLGGAPKGLHSLSLGLIMLAARPLSSRLLVQRRWQEIVITIFGATVHGLVVCALAVEPGTTTSFSPSVWELTRTLPMQVFLTALAAPLVYPLLQSIDHRWWPVPRGLRS